MIRAKLRTYTRSAERGATGEIHPDQRTPRKRSSGWGNWMEYVVEANLSKGEKYWD